MRTTLFCLICITLVIGSCGGTKKSRKESSPAPVVSVVPMPVTAPEPAPVPEPVKEEPPIVKEEPVEAPIKEITEKLVPVQAAPPAPDKYFVIIGSFRNYDNAVNYQNMIKKDGFTSVLLKNEQGLHRVSVLSTNEITEARTKIKSIRTAFPKYHDTWLLIQVK